MQGQWRVGFSRPVGFDMTAAFALASGLGISPHLIAEFLPEIESAALSAMRDAEDTK